MNTSISYRNFQFVLRLSIFLVISLPFRLNGQNLPVKQWERTLGGNQDDQLVEVKQTADGGSILGGRSDSGLSGDKSQNSKGSNDFWIVKLDSKGKVQWDKTLGGSGVDNLFALHQTPDGGFLLGGESSSGKSYDKTDPAIGGVDFWFVKLDAKGNKLWDKTYGREGDERFRHFIQTPDGGFLIGGESPSGIHGDSTNKLLNGQTNYGGYDYWLLKLDPDGNKLWEQTIIEGHDDQIRYLIASADGGYVLGGYLKLINPGVADKDSYYASNFWILKLDPEGNIQWEKSFGSRNTYDFPLPVFQTADGGFLLGGNSQKFNSPNRFAEGYDESNGRLIKLDNQGTLLWEKIIDTGIHDIIQTVIQTPDKHYVVLGNSGQYFEHPDSAGVWNDDLVPLNFWIIKLKEDGEEIWKKKYDSNRFTPQSIHRKQDKDYFVMGSFYRNIKGYDNSLATGRSVQETWVINLNKRGKQKGIIRIDRSGKDNFDRLILTQDKGFIIWGRVLPDWYKSKYWIVKYGRKKPWRN